MPSTSKYAGLDDKALAAKIIAEKTRLTDGGCLEMVKGICKNGYAKLCVKRKNTWAHRLIYSLVRGPIGKGLDVCHKCDNRKCVNPDHLFLGTRAENMQDAVNKGRQAKGAALPGTKLTDEMIGEIVEKARSGMLFREIAKTFGICKQHAGKIAINHGVRRYVIRK